MRGNTLDVEEFRGKLGNTCVRANLGCQLDYTCNELKPKYLGKPVKDFLCRVFWGGDTNPKTRSHFLVAAHTKGHGRTKSVLSVGLPRSHWPVHPSCAIPSLALAPPESGLQHLRTTNSPLRHPGTPAPDWDYWDIQACELKPTGSLASPLGNSHCWTLGPQPVRHSETPYI